MSGWSERLERALAWIDRKASGWGVVRTGLVVGLSAWCLSLLLYFSPQQYIELPRWHEFAAQCENPLDREVARPMLQYRIMTPLIAWALHLRGFSAVSIQYVAMIGTLVVLYAASARVVQPSRAALITFTVSLTFVTQWVNIFPGYPDSVSHLVSAWCLLCPCWPVSLVATVVGGLNDERFSLAIPFLMLWPALSGRTLERKHYARFVAGFLAGGLLLLLLRHALTAGWLAAPIIKPFTYESIWQVVVVEKRLYYTTWPKFFVSIFMGYRWAWLYVLLAGGLLLRDRKVAGVLYAGSLLAAVMSTGTVLDVSRSISFFYPSLVAAMCLLFRRQMQPRLAIAILILLALTPVITFIGERPFSMLPPAYQWLRGSW